MPRLGGALDIVQVGDPATPAAGRQFLYFKSDGILYTKKSNGTVTPVGSGATTSPMNAARVVWTSNGASITVTGWTGATVGDLVLSNVKAGDLVQVDASFIWSNAGVEKYADIVSIAADGATPVSSWGTSTYSATSQGMVGLRVEVGDTGFQAVSDSAQRVLTASDIVNGQVTLRLICRGPNTTARQIIGTTDYPIRISATVLAGVKGDPGANALPGQGVKVQSLLAAAANVTATTLTAVSGGPSITVPADGTYTIKSIADFTWATGDGTLVAQAMVNGGNPTGIGAAIFFPSTGGNRAVVENESVLALKAGDVITMGAFKTSGTGTSTLNSGHTRLILDGDASTSSSLVTQPNTWSQTQDFSGVGVGNVGVRIGRGVKLDLGVSAYSYIGASSTAGEGFTDAVAGDTIVREDNGGQILFGVATAANASQASEMSVNSLGVNIRQRARFFDIATPSTPASGSLLYSSSGRMYSMGTAGQAVPLDAIYYSNFISAAASTSVTTGAALFNFPVLPPGTYAFEANGAYSTAATTTGIRFALSLSGTISPVLLSAMIATSATANWNGSAAALSTFVGPTTSGSTAIVPFQVTGLLRVTAQAAGSLQYTSGVSGSAVTVAAGAYIRVTKIG